MQRPLCSQCPGVDQRERCAMATHLVLCSSDVWVNPNVDQVSTAWRKGTMFGCTTPGVPRSQVDMPWRKVQRHVLEGVEVVRCIPGFPEPEAGAGAGGWLSRTRRSMQCHHRSPGFEEYEATMSGSGSAYASFTDSEHLSSTAAVYAYSRGGRWKRDHTGS